MNKSIYILFTALVLSSSLAGQEKRGYQWIMGGNSVGSGVRMNFNSTQVSIFYEQTGIKMEGSNTSMCDEEGNLLFYSNGCVIVNAMGEVMQNGDSINPGIIQNFYCPFGGSPIGQGVVAIPAPESESLYYVFNLDFDFSYLEDTSFLGVAPQRLYYQVIDMTQDEGRGAIVSKNQIAVLDTLARANIQAVRHANGRDWWIMVPKSHSNCYFLVLVTPEGVQPPLLKCEGHVWSDDDSGAQAVFSPDLKKYIRFNSWNGLNIFDFDNATGDLSNPLQIMFPNDTINYIAGVAVSPNSRYLYVCARKKVYQFDLEAANIEASKVQVAEWDGTYNPYATIFYLAALAPDGKIYISSTSSTLNLHVIEEPDNPGLSCQLVQRGVNLPSYNFATIPNIPHYCSSNEDCETSTNSAESVITSNSVAIYPNPTRGEIWINFPEIKGKEYGLRLYDLLGKQVFSTKITQPLSNWDISMLSSGTYFFFIERENFMVSGKIIRIN